ncbi:unnamed protein product [Thlaspi arvense]|uniref:ERAD-associated E3 ubiquitin-protein ligase component HRD3A n=1 Tax=Thlaspi arvense TaxID=13288 RepID=A0AAU9S464_THLAR|nr:unnamed protein product [Thlaspi arvense]
MRRCTALLFSVLLLFSLLFVSSTARQFVLFLSQDDLNDTPLSAAGDDDSSSSVSSGSDWDEFGDSDAKTDEELDPGSWRPVLESDSATGDPATEVEAQYYSGVTKMVEAVSSGDPRLMDDAASQIEAAAAAGYPHAQSALGFLYNLGITRERNRAKAFMYHCFAADGGNMQSKMALAYAYFRQEMYDKAVKLYAELAEIAVNSFLISKDSPVLEPVRIHSGAEENEDILRKSRGEEDEDFQILEYQAQKGNSGAMYRIGVFYYFGLRGVRRDHGKALSWFLKAVDMGEPKSMELLGRYMPEGLELRETTPRHLSGFHVHPSIIFIQPIMG